MIAIAFRRCRTATSFAALLLPHGASAQAVAPVAARPAAPASLPQPPPVFDAPSWLRNDPRRASNRLSYRAGGLMSDSTIFDIDLDSGRSAFEQRPPHPRAGEGRQRDGTLDGQTLPGIRRLALAAIADGMETPVCRQRRAATATVVPPAPPPPLQADAMVDFYVLLDGHDGNAPSQGDCWSKAARDLYAAALAAVDPPAATNRNSRPWLGRIVALRLR